MCNLIYRFFRHLHLSSCHVFAYVDPLLLLPSVSVIPHAYSSLHLTRDSPWHLRSWLPVSLRFSNESSPTSPIFPITYAFRISLPYSGDHLSYGIITRLCFSLDTGCTSHQRRTFLPDLAIRHLHLLRTDYSDLSHCGSYRRFLGLSRTLAVWGIGIGGAVTLFMSPIPVFQRDILKKIPVVSRTSILAGFYLGWSSSSSCSSSSSFDPSPSLPSSSPSTDIIFFCSP